VEAMGSDGSDGSDGNEGSQKKKKNSSALSNRRPLKISLLCVAMQIRPQSTIMTMTMMQGTRTAYIQIESYDPGQRMPAWRYGRLGK